MKPKSDRVRLSNVQGIRKRKQILSAAGHVFAEKGYDGAGMRDIAAVCHTPPSALIYHFGSKENLFTETLKFHIIENGRLECIFDPFRQADPTNSQTISDALHESISDLLRVCHGPTGRAPNLNGLIICLLTDSSLPVSRAFQQFGDAIMGHVFHMLMENNPKLTPTDIFWWSHLFWSQIFYPVVGRQLLLAETKQRKFSREFIKSMAWRIASQVCMPLGLPCPGGKDEWEFEITEEIRTLVRPPAL